MDNMFVNESEMEEGRSRKGYIEHTDVVEYYNIAYLLGEHLYMYISFHLFSLFDQKRSP